MISKPPPPDLFGSFQGPAVYTGETEPSSGLVKAGAAVMGIGVGIALVGPLIGTILADSNPCAASTPYGFIPLVGGFVLAAEFPNYAIQDRYSGVLYDCRDFAVPVSVIGVVDSVLQITGLSLLLGGSFARSPVTSDELSARRSPAFAILPTASPSHAGVTIVLGEF